MKSTKEYNYKIPSDNDWSGSLRITANDTMDAVSQIGYFYYNNIQNLETFDLLIKSDDGDTNVKATFSVNVSDRGLIDCRYLIVRESKSITAKTLAYEGEPESQQWTWEVLNDLTTEELEVIKTTKKDELYEVQQHKHTIIANILSLQEMIRDEKIMGIGAIAIKEGAE